MMRVKAIFTNRYFLFGLGAAALVALVWAAGAWLAWPMAWRLVGAAGMLLLCMAGLLVSVLRTRRAAAVVEQSVKRQAEAQKQPSRADQPGGVAALEKRLDQAVRKLKASKLGRGRRGKAALYALPWYVLMGPPGAGKTTAIANSGLNFPLGAGRKRGVGGTRNCDWFFSDEAILLDTAGRYVTEDDAAEEWHALLRGLKEHRPERPVNGLVVNISIAELIDAATEDIEWYANQMRRRIDELIEQLGVRLPVYLVFTKGDLLSGFTEFFGDLPRRERQQVWGHAFAPLPSGAGGNQTEAAPSAARARFEQAFDPLVTALADRRVERLRRPMKQEDRHKVYAFPLEFSAVKAPLAHFIGELFQANPYQESPIFRGFYFTSGTQEGAPLNRVIPAIGEESGLSRGRRSSEAEQGTRSYFLKDFFTEVVVPDQHLVSQTARASKRGRLKRAGVSVAALVVLALFALGATQALVRSQLRLGDVQEAAEAVRAVDWASSAASTSEALVRMDRLRRQVARLERREEDPPLLSWGLTRDARVLGPARQLYHRKARAFLYQHPLQTLRRRLRRAARRQQPAQRSARYDDLRAYLLLTSEEARLDAKADRAFLEAHLTSLLDSTLLPRAAGAGPVPEVLRKQLRRQVAATVGGLSREQVRPFQAEASLVADARNLIYEEPSVDGLYRRLKEEGNATLPPFTLAETVPRRDLHLFATRPEVPGFFTKAGWANFAQEAIAAQDENARRGDWVLGHDPEDLPEEMQDRDQLAEALKERYFGEYAAQWQRFLHRLRLARFEDVGTATRAMTRLASQADSPVLYLLARVTKETTFRSRLAEGAKRQLKETGERMANRQARRLTRAPDAGLPQDAAESAELPLVDRRFAALHALKAERAVSGGASTSLYAAMEELGRLRGVLDGMQSGHGGGKAVQYAKGVFQDEGGALARMLRSVRSALNRLDPQARRPLFDKPMILAWEAVLKAAQKELNERWRATVYQPYRARLAGLYPFDASSSQGAPLKVVEDLFHPEEGAVAAFYAEELAPFVGSDMEARAFEGHALQLSPAARQALRKARGLSNGLFEGGVLRLPFAVQAELPERSEEAPPVDQVYLTVGGRESAYRMGSYRPWTRLEWPGGPGAALGVSTQEGDLAPKQFDGPWAWFRLLQQAQVRRATSTVYRVRWPFEQPGRYTIVARYNLRTQNGAGPFNDVRRFFDLQLPARLN